MSQMNIFREELYYVEEFFQDGMKGSFKQTSYYFFPSKEIRNILQTDRKEICKKFAKYKLSGSHLITKQQKEDRKNFLLIEEDVLQRVLERIASYRKNQEIVKKKKFENPELRKRIKEYTPEVEEQLLWVQDVRGIERTGIFINREIVNFYDRGITERFCFDNLFDIDIPEIKSAYLERYLEKNIFFKAFKDYEIYGDEDESKIYIKVKINGNEYIFDTENTLELIHKYQPVDVEEFKIEKVFVPIQKELEILTEEKEEDEESTNNQALIQELQAGAFNGIVYKNRVEKEQSTNNPKQDVDTLDEIDGDESLWEDSGNTWDKTVKDVSINEINASDVDVASVSMDEVDKDYIDNTDFDDIDDIDIPDIDMPDFSNMKIDTI